ncbi:Uncharacterised protein r2_g155 [Pycnogonum litorale]
MVGFYRRMMPNFAHIMTPLSNMLTAQVNAKQLLWDDRSIKSFDDSKSALLNSVTLPHPDPNAKEYQIVCDASSFAIGAALHQMVNGQATPLHFFSKKLTNTQLSYSTYDRELLAAYLAVLKFRHWIEGRQITLFTDHKPLASSFRSHKEAKTDKQQRYWTVISEYVSDVQYVRGSDNVVADCLSRSVNSVRVDCYDLLAIAEAQQSDEQIRDFTCKLSSYPLNDLSYVSSPVPRPYVPSSMRREICAELHNICHPGVGPTLKLVKSRYFWPDMDREIRTWTKACVNQLKFTNTPSHQYLRSTFLQTDFKQFTSISSVRFQLPIFLIQTFLCLFATYSLVSTDRHVGLPQNQ